MKIIQLFLFLLLSTSLFAQNDLNVTLTPEQLIEQNRVAEEERLKEEKEKLAEQKRFEIAAYESELQALEQEIPTENVWIKSYASYLTSLDVKNNLEKIKERINYLVKNAKTISDGEELSVLIEKETLLSSQVDKLKGRSAAPFSNLLVPPVIGEVEKISNPFDIFTGLSAIKTIRTDLDEYKLKKESLEGLIVLLRKENKIYEILQNLDSKEKYEKIKRYKSLQLERFETALDTIVVTLEVYQKRLEIVQVDINKGIEKQIYSLMKIAMIILVVFIIFFLLKLVVKRYITDNERFYMANKMITFANFSVIILILFLNYIENVSHLVTILGFASAGIAIAMKDWFMSILGWLVIVIGGSISVGDRIRVIMDGAEYVGDVMDVSLLRMTVLEEITLTSVTKNRRAGRIIFVPNNYVFTRMIANYTHSSLKTVWDGVHITITFDSNHKKAMHIAKEAAKKFSKGYTDITRKQLNKLRQHYSLKNTNVEPRIYSFIEPNGIVIDAWYLTNAYATLTLRSVISLEIVEAFNAADDITIAYPTQNLHIQNHERTTPPEVNDGEVI
ncbi:mechanosensitive ion channel [Sulfurimonas aquatica]|uniref:Mechanosensitive ion channel n=1 Tax=Sulfurimonas aquatica TaxID=2672570 RepID=A0A975GCW1_9BACT|nr:mechanosensitive ion channel domain-containing protein [Sulfurimonas aquatica]QSZ41694.1 mechanosensitive ion channel [Sulfurimonas aquatica]